MPPMSFLLLVQRMHKGKSRGDLNLIFCHLKILPIELIA